MIDFIEDQTEYKAKLKGCGTTVYTIANVTKIAILRERFTQKIRFVRDQPTLLILSLVYLIELVDIERGSDFAHQVDFRLYKLTAKQRRVLQNGRENRKMYIDEHKWQKQLHNDLMSASGETSANNDTTEGEEGGKSWADYSLRERKHRYLTRTKRDRFRLLVDGNFDAGDLFVTLTFIEEQIAEAEKLFKRFLKQLRKFYHDKLGVELKYVWVFEYGDFTHRKHVHILVNSVNEDCRDRIKTKITKMWKGTSELNSAGDMQDEVRLAVKNGDLDIAEIDRKLGVLAAYMSKDFGKEDRLLFAKEYDHSKNLIPVVEAVIDIEPSEYYTPLAINREQGEIETWKYFEGLPQMACKRLLKAPYVFDEPNGDKSATISGTIIDVSEEVAAGKIGERRSIADVEYIIAECKGEFIGVIDETLLIGDIDDEMIWQPSFVTEKQIRQRYAVVAA